MNSPLSSTLPGPTVTGMGPQQIPVSVMQAQIPGLAQQQQQQAPMQRMQGPQMMRPQQQLQQALTSPGPQMKQYRLVQRDVSGMQQPRMEMMQGQMQLQQQVQVQPQQQQQLMQQLQQQQQQQQQTSEGQIQMQAMPQQTILQNQGIQVSVFIPIRHTAQ